MFTKGTIGAKSGLAPKLAVLLCGAAAAVILLELGLRIAGSAQLQKASRQDPDNDGGYRIVCLGDSFTFGVGADKDKSYPAQLQKMLDRAGGKKFKVLNRGVNSFNTTMILTGFRERLDKEPPPDMVILMAGGANTWNAVGRTKDSRIRDFFLNMKVYKLARLLTKNISQKLTGQKEPAAGAGEADKPGLSAKEREEQTSLYKRFTDLMEQDAYGEALKVAYRLKELSPSSASSYIRIARVYFRMHDVVNAGEYYQKAIEIDPKDAHIEHTYAAFTRCFMQSQDRARIAYGIDFLTLGLRQHPDLKYFIQMLRNQNKYLQELYPWINSDIKEIARLCRQRGIKLLIMTYPRGEVYEYNVNTIIKQIAREEPLDMVDNEKVFRRLLSTGYKVEDLFVPDTHCNARGYAVIAENIYGKLIEDGILNTDQKEVGITSAGHPAP